MKRVLIFLLCSAALIGLIQVVEGWMPTADPFDIDRPYVPLDFEGFSEEQIAFMKIRHAAKRGEPYDIGLFGNSRILSVGREDMAVGECSVFNFGLSGQSFRSTADMLLRLARKNALPQFAIISIDNFELQMYNNPYVEGWRERLQSLARDLKAGFRDTHTSLRGKFRIFWRFVWTETILFKRQFELAFLRRGATGMLGLNNTPFQAVEGSVMGYLPDGSIKSPFPVHSGKVPLLSRTTPQIIDVIFQHDLERVFRLARDNKLSLFIYESPLHPASAALFERAPSSFAAANRMTLSNTCKKYSVKCVAASGKDFFGPARWNDPTHPPADALGHWVSAFVRPELHACTP